MIVIHDFKEAYALYRQDLIPFRLLQDQAIVLLDMCPQSGRHVSNALEIRLNDIDWLLLQPEAEEPYEGYLGGNCSICQTKYDLKAVVGIDFEFAKANDNKWPSVLDQVMSWDQCRFVDEANGEPEWALFLLCWNDSGGPVFYVPKYLWEVARVAEHVAETDRHWNAKK